MEGKKKRKAFSITEKLEAIDRAKTMGRPKVCRELGLSESTLRGWVKEEDKLRSYSSSMDSQETNLIKSALK